MAAFGYLAFCEDSHNDLPEEINWATVRRLPAREARSHGGSSRSSIRSAASRPTTAMSQNHDRFYTNREIDDHVDLNAVDNAIQRPALLPLRLHHRRPSDFAAASRGNDGMPLISSGQRRIHQSASSNRPSPQAVSSSTGTNRRRVSNTQGPALSSLAANVVSTTNSIVAAQVNQVKSSSRSRRMSVSSTNTDATASSYDSNASTGENSAIPPVPRRATARNRGDQRR